MLTRRTILKSALLLPTLPYLLERSAQAQQFVTQDAGWLVQIAQQLRDEFNLPAVWVAVNIEDKIEAAVVGVRNANELKPATLEDPLTIASISKPFVGFWIATLVDEGKIAYDTRVLEVLPELEAVCLPEHQGITLGQLLTHTAAIARDASNIPNNLPLEGYPAERIREAKEILAKPSPPDSRGKELYSNNGVTLAASMAERVAGEPYEIAAGRFYRQRLGLESWGVWPMSLKNDLILPWPHSRQGKTYFPQPPSSVQYQFVRPSGSAHCTISDLVRFGLMATNATALAQSALSPGRWQQILTPIPDTGTALSCFSIGNEVASYSHGGSLGTTNSFLRVVPEWGVAVAAHINSDGNEFGATGRAVDLIFDHVRKQRAEGNPPPSCRMGLTNVTTVDASWKNAVMPRTTDDKVRIRVQFRVDAQPQTGDLQTLVKLGDVERRDDRFRGLASGNHTLHFEFDTPKTQSVAASVQLDALGTGGNTTPDGALFESVLRLN